MTECAVTRSDNVRKHTTRNPLQRLLIKRFHGRLMQLLDGLEFSTALDAGCGEAFILPRLAARYTGARFTAMDREAQALRYPGNFPAGVPRVCGDAARMPYRDGAFDVVVITEVLEHLETPAVCLREIRRVTRRYLVATVPNEPYFRLANLLRCKNIAALGNDPGHIQHWSSAAFAVLVNEQFRLLRRTTSFPWTLVAAERRD